VPAIKRVRAAATIKRVRAAATRLRRYPLRIAHARDDASQWRRRFN
jgi:hypothetical protein